jgi:hypothetical protein
MGTADARAVAGKKVQQVSLCVVADVFSVGQRLKGVRGRRRRFAAGGPSFLYGLLDFSVGYIFVL